MVGWLPSQSETNDVEGFGKAFKTQHLERNGIELGEEQPRQDSLFSRTNEGRIENQWPLRLGLYDVGLLSVSSVSKKRHDLIQGIVFGVVGLAL